MNKKEKWDTIISPHHSLLSLNIKEIWQYRDLLRMFVKRDFVTYYKQTILGPLWFFIQPIFTTIIYVVVFSRIAKISTDGLPPVLFYLCGITIWNYFADCLNKTSTVFKDNQSIFGKVYFPRLITPMSIVISNLIKLSIQLLLFILILAYYVSVENLTFEIRVELLIVPLLILLIALLGLGLGMAITSLTTRYRDLFFLLQFGVQLLMYASPVIYPLSSIPEKHHWLLKINPLTGILEGFRFAFFGGVGFSYDTLIYSAIVTIIVFIIGTFIFNKTEKNFMDTV